MNLGDVILVIPPLLLALSLHEWAHGYTALQCGDPTAKMAGRLTLNPIAHLDPIGAILLVLMALGAFPMGWAKPVPVNYFNLRSPKRDMAIVAAAGPLSNISLGLVSALILGAWDRWGTISSGTYPLFQMLLYSVSINCGLAAFNVLPIFPLDGSRIMAYLLPYPYSEHYARIEPFGWIILILLIVSGVAHVIIEPIYEILKSGMFLVSNLIM